MRTPSRIGIASLGVAALGWGAALGLFAPTASAATSQASPATYDSKATATMGGVSVPDVSDSALSVTTVAEHGTSNSPQRARLGVGTALSALRSTPGPGAALATALKAANPGGTQLAEVEATASRSGTSTACATVLSADCAPGQARPQVLRLGLSDLAAGLAASPLSDVAGRLPDPLADYSVVVTIAGPQATCTAGPSGSGELSAAASSPASATVDLQDNGKSVLPSGAAPLTDGSVFTALRSAVKSSPLNSVLSAVTAATPLSVTLSPGSHSVSGSTATASTGQVTFVSGTVPLLDIRAATVTCGTNTPVSDSYVPRTSKSVAGTGTWGAPTSSLTSDLPALQGVTG